MARYDCEVCCGRGLVRLQIQRRTSVVDFKAAEMIPMVAELAYRDYPCPECGDVIPLERLATVEFHSMVNNQITDPEFTKHAMNGAAHRLIDELLAKNFIRMQRGPDDSSQFRYPLVATLAVVSPQHVATLEDRVAQHQEVVAQEVVDEAIRQISNWCSDYTGDEGRIRKSEAIDDVRRALKDVLAKRTQKKVAA